SLRRWFIFEYQQSQRDRFRQCYKPRLEQLEDRTLLDGSAAGTNPLLQAYGQIPLSFEANQGQTDSAVNFLSRGSGYSLFLTPTEAVLSLQKPLPHDPASRITGPAPAGDVVRMSVVGANPAAHVVGLDAQATTSNY